MDTAAIILSFAINIASAWLWLRWLGLRDVYAVKKRQRRAVPLFASMGLLSAPFCLLFYRLQLWAPLVVDAPSYFLFVNAPSEELAKFLVFYLVARLSRSVKDPFDAAIQGASVGLGFAVTENFTYALDVEPAFMLLRVVACTASHMTYAAISAFSWGAAEYYLKGRKERGAWGFTVLGLGVATLAHAFHNTLCDINERSFALAFIFDLCLLGGLSFLLSDGVKLSPYYRFPLAKWKEALSWLDWGIRRDGGNWVLRLRRGLYLLRGGYFEDAAEDFELAALVSGDPLPGAWREATARLLGRGEPAAFARSVEALDAEGRVSFFRAIRRVLEGRPRAKALLEEVEGMAAAYRPRRKAEPPAWDELPGSLLRGPAAARRLASARMDYGAKERAAARPAGTRPFATSKEKSFAYLMRKRRERELEI